MSKRSLRTPLELRLEGPGVRNSRISLDDLSLLSGHLQAAIKRVGQVLSGGVPSTQAGRKPSRVEATCTLQVVSIKAGSVTMLCDLPVQAEPDMFGDLGERAVECFVRGIGALEEDGGALPPGYDRGVLIALGEEGKLFERGIERISFSLRTRKECVASSYTPEVHARLLARMEQPVESSKTLEGRLLMGDFKESGLRCRIHPPFGPPVRCTFQEKHKNAILSALTHYVRLVGEAKESSGRIREFKIENIEILDTESQHMGQEQGRIPFFAPTQDLAALAAQQGVQPISDFRRLVCKLWPENESVDEFLDTIRAWREEGSEGKLV